MSSLASKQCAPCQGGIPPLRGEALQELYKQLRSGWELVNEHHLEKTFQFSSFREALEFTKKLGELAEANGHHPVIVLDFKKVKVTYWTHKIDGLHESDFVMAAKSDMI